MDLIKIGIFIAELRKKQKLTQEQLGEKLGVTNKTVSRWETGTYLPPAEALLAMSELFGVSINELLSGKRLSEAEYRQAAEENLKQTVKTSSFTLKDRIDFYKSKWLKEHRVIMILIGIGIVRFRKPIRSRQPEFAEIIKVLERICKKSEFCLKRGYNNRKYIGSVS